jgi:two-component system chemotaxis response regulator CheB
MIRRPEIVAIGTSLGGLHALSVLLGALPGRLPVPVVVAQHRATDGDGRGLGALLQEHTAMPVQDAEDKMELAPGAVYLAPSDYHLLVEAPGLAALSTEAPVRSARPSIDVLFETVAEAYGPGALGILLTGASRDGADGVAAIKARGGRVIVQDPASAESATMPAAALAAAAVDYVLPLEEIGHYVMSLVEGTRV